MVLAVRKFACVLHIAVSGMLALSVVTHAEEPANPRLAAASEYPRVEDRATEQWLMRSNEGFQYRILISRPTGQPPQSGYPVVYVVDGNAWSGVAAELARLSELEVGPAIVVGIGYVTDAFLDSRRYYDLTPSAVALKSLPQEMAQMQYGGADVFLNFIEQSVKPAIRNRYPIDSRRQVLFGHSLGGLFTLHVLFTKPQSFSSYVAVSPSIWWNDRAVLSEEQQFSRQDHAAEALTLFVGVGELEQKSDAAEEQKVRRLLERNPEFLGGRTISEAMEQYRERLRRSRMVDNAKELATRVVATGVKTQFYEFASEDHLSVVPAALRRALPIALRRVQSTPAASSERK